ncbi:flagellar hook-length control protein FliK [Rhodobacteraceae bacterium RKSG542]|uniref:flagellar hook-length control protein FliK n=1 Tax=Pseudovibrio flavus TaxID=2529854 RepID=UPI0012BC36E2|nr:flagellar hook-length control protein FliK [Pseudovibrio flavus]MTI16770.1 flagellar hook-length control protein FliK [Pseudovibrio flavus]
MNSLLTVLSASSNQIKGAAGRTGAENAAADDNGFSSFIDDMGERSKALQPKGENTEAPNGDALETTVSGSGDGETGAMPEELKNLLDSINKDSQKDLSSLLEQVGSELEVKLDASKVENPADALKVLKQVLAAQTLRAEGEGATLLPAEAGEDGVQLKTAQANTQVSAIDKLLQTTGLADSTSALKAAKIGEGQSAILQSYLGTSEKPLDAKLQSNSAAQALGQNGKVPLEGLVKPQEVQVQLSDQMAKQQGALADLQASGSLKTAATASQVSELQLEAANNGTGKSAGAEALDVKVLKTETHLPPALDNRIPAKQVGDAILKTLPEIRTAREQSAQLDIQRAPQVMKQLDIQLRPDNLGVVKVSMQLRGNELNVSMVTSTIEAFEMLQKDTNVLSKILREAGYRAENAQISVQFKDDAADSFRQSTGNGDRGFVNHGQDERSGSSGRQAQAGEGEGGSNNHGPDHADELLSSGAEHASLSERDVRSGHYF